MATDSLPSPRDGAYDRIARRVEQQREEIQALKHDLRRLHKRSHDGTVCLEDTSPWPCPTVQRIDLQPAVTA